MNQLDFSMRGRIIEKCREAGELADALYHDDNRHDVVREQAYSKIGRASCRERV